MRYPCGRHDVKAGSFVRSEKKGLCLSEPSPDLQGKDAKAGAEGPETKVKLCLKSSEGTEEQLSRTSSKQLPFTNKS